MLPQALKKVVIYCILSPYGEEQSDLIHRISKDRKLEKIPTYKYVTVLVGLSTMNNLKHFNLLLSFGLLPFVFLTNPFYSYKHAITETLSLMVVNM